MLPLKCLSDGQTVFETTGLQLSKIGHANLMLQASDAEVRKYVKQHKFFQGEIV